MPCSCDLRPIEGILIPTQQGCCCGHLSVDGNIGCLPGRFRLQHQSLEDGLISGKLSHEISPWWQTSTSIRRSKTQSTPQTAALWARACARPRGRCFGRLVDAPLPTDVDFVLLLRVEHPSTESVGGAIVGPALCLLSPPNLFAVRRQWGGHFRPS